MKLATKTTLLVTLILVVTLGSLAGLSYYQMRRMLLEQLEDRLLDTAYYAAQDKDVKEALLSGDPIQRQKIGGMAEDWRRRAGFDFIVVINQIGIRLTHPVAENVGRPFEGGDEARVLQKGESYISEATGTLGESKRAFVPVLAGGVQIGAVSVGTTLVEINHQLTAKLNQFAPFIVLSLVIGVGGAFALTANIKESIFGLEPEEIALLLKEKEAILDHVKEGIITLDEHGHLIQHNQEAARILRLADQSAEGIIQSLRQDVRTESVHPGIDQELTLGDVSILYKYSVLKNARGKVLGQVINFRDTTEVREMAEELTGVKRMAWSLRAQNHEFLNKLHTIAGLIQLNEPEEALSYITATAHGNASFSSLITEKIKNVNIAALILAKYYKAEENRVSLALDPSSCLEEQPRGLRTDEMETVIGNLLENSLDAVATDGSGSISLLIRQEPDQLIIRVKNNGPAIPEAIREKIFEANFSTKAGQRGYGLHFIRRIIDRNQGMIRLVQTEDVTWDIKIPIKGDVVS